MYKYVKTPKFAMKTGTCNIKLMGITSHLKQFTVLILAQY